MNRTFSAIAVLAMLLAAVALCAKQTIASGLIDDWTRNLLLAAEVAVAGLVIATAVSLLRHRFARLKSERPNRRQVPATV